MRCDAMTLHNPMNAMYCYLYNIQQKSLPLNSIDSAPPLKDAVVLFPLLACEMKHE